MRTLNDLDRPGTCIILVLNDFERRSFVASRIHSIFPLQGVFWLLHFGFRRNDSSEVVLLSFWNYCFSLGVHLFVLVQQTSPLPLFGLWNGVVRLTDSLTLTHCIFCALLRKSSGRGDEKEFQKWELNWRFFDQLHNNHPNQWGMNNKCLALQLHISPSFREK
jgi:hypothetical protein